ncbi:hypothetical protein PM082_003225 [Marasmius tenuissimus]|nr:hypothetical protein PM082_003225 [Marasmius tenuissimus]
MMAHAEEQPNQWHSVPRNIIDTKVPKYWRWGYGDQRIADCILADIRKEDPDSQYTLCRRTIQRARARLKLSGTRQLNVPIEDILPFIAELKRKHGNMGARTIVQRLRVQYSIKVPEKRVADFLREVEKDKVDARKYRTMKRRVYYTAGVMDILSVDQHDKWSKWQLYLHLGVEICSGKLLWITIWWTNRNPRLICSNYLNACRSIGGVPVLTQSDPGTENYGIANSQTYIRQKLDPALKGTLQHKWMTKTKNVKPEIQWSVMRKVWTPEFEKLLEEGERLGFYAPNDPDDLERFTFRWLAIPFFQAELDEYVANRNATPRRANRKKVLPGGVPDHIFESPDLFDVKNFMIHVPPSLFDETEALYAPPDDPVFQLVPPLIGTIISTAYRIIHEPNVTFDTFWAVYRDLIAEVRRGAMEIDIDLKSVVAEEQSVFDVEMVLTEGKRYCPGLDSFPKPSHCADSDDEEVINVNQFPDADDEDDEVIQVNQFTDVDHADQEHDVFGDFVFDLDSALDESLEQ